VKTIGKIRTIFLDKWEEYRKENSVRLVEKENVNKMLSCRTPLMGKHLYKCELCDYEVELPHTCKSRFCPVCGYAATDNWIRSRFSFLLDCYYHHVVVTVPAYFRWMIKQNRTLTLNLFAKLAAESILNWSKRRGYEVGIICFFHSFGARLQFHPHFHLLVSAGGITKKGQWHHTDEEIPGSVLMPIFRKTFTAFMKQYFYDGKLTTKAPLQRIFYQMNKQSDEHWQFYTERITRDGTHTMKYCARYCKKMILSEKRIKDYDGKEVTFWNSKHSQVLVYGVMQFIKCVVQHIPNKYFRLIRYYGFYSNKSKKKYQIACKYWKPLQEKKEPNTWRNRQLYYQQRDPLKCPKCGIELKLTMVIYPEPWFKRTIEKIKESLDLAIPLRIKLDYG